MRSEQSRSRSVCWFDSHSVSLFISLFRCASLFLFPSVLRSCSHLRSLAPFRLRSPWRRVLRLAVTIHDPRSVPWVDCLPNRSPRGVGRLRLRGRYGDSSGIPACATYRSTSLNTPPTALGSLQAPVAGNSPSQVHSPGPGAPRSAPPLPPPNHRSPSSLTLPARPSADPAVTLLTQSPSLRIRSVRASPRL